MTEDSASGSAPEPAVEPRAQLVHPRATRWMHWINFPLLFVMIWSGMRIYWANDVYAFGIGGWELFKFWPDPVNETLQLEARLARGIAYHLNLGWFFVLNGVAYVTFLAFSGEWRHLVPERAALKDIPGALAHDLHIRKEAPPQGRYNVVQQLSYSAVLVMAFMLVLSGFAIYKPTQLALLTTLMGGYTGARLIHFAMTIGLLLFFVVHVVQVAREGTGAFLGMVTGYRKERR